MTAYTGAVPETPRPTDWRSTAACAPADVDPNLFYASERQPDQIREARAVCNRCPARTPCLLAGYAEEDDTTIRAGLTRRQRRHYLRKANGNTARAVAEALADPLILLKHIYRQHTQPAPGGHMVWTDRRHCITVRGEAHSVHQLAWIALYGARPVGSVQRVCDVDGCVAKDCLTDRRSRDRVAQTAATKTT